jgi:hypothetical protein
METNLRLNVVVMGDCLHLEDFFVVGSKASAQFVAQDDRVQLLKFVANHGLISKCANHGLILKCARVGAVDMMHRDSVDDEGMDVADSARRKERHWLVVGGRDRKNFFSTRAVIVRSFNGLISSALIAWLLDRWAKSTLMWTRFCSSAMVGTEMVNEQSTRQTFAIKNRN